MEGPQLGSSLSSRSSHSRPSTCSSSHAIESGSAAVVDIGGTLDSDVDVQGNSNSISSSSSSISSSSISSERSSNGRHRPGLWNASPRADEAVATRSDAELSAAEALVIFVYKLHTSPAPLKPGAPPVATMSSVGGGRCDRGDGRGGGGGGGGGISGNGAAGNPVWPSGAPSLLTRPVRGRESEASKGYEGSAFGEGFPRRSGGEG